MIHESRSSVGSQNRLAQGVAGGVVLLILAASGLVFFGSGAVSAQSPQVTHVTIVRGAYLLTNTAYSPDVITVVIGVNNTVVWLNNDTVAHTAVGTNFNSGNINPSMTAQITFDQTGTFMYHCIYHPNMQGEVIVKGSGTAQSSTTHSSTSTKASTSLTSTTSARSSSTTSQAQPTTATSQYSPGSSYNGVPEFPGQLIPVLGTTVIALVGYLLVRGRARSQIPSGL